MEYPETQQNPKPLQETIQDQAHVAMDQAQEALHRADVYVRENPVPTILGALALGFALGILVRGSAEPTPRSRWNDLRDQADDTHDDLRSLLKALGKKGRKAYKKGNSSIRDAVEEAADAVRNVDVDDYTDPVTNWFHKLWKRAF